MLLHYQWVLCSKGVVATIAPQATPMVKAYVKTIGQPTHNVIGQALILMMLHSKQQDVRTETTIGEGTLGRLRYFQPNFIFTNQ